MTAGADVVRVVESGRVTVSARFLGPSMTLGARIRVSRGDDGKLARTYSWDYSLGLSENYAEAVRLWLVERGEGWGGCWVLGSVARGYVAVRAGALDVEGVAVVLG